MPWPDRFLSGPSVMLQKVARMVPLEWGLLVQRKGVSADSVRCQFQWVQRPPGATSQTDPQCSDIMPSSGSCRVSWADATEKRSYEGGGIVDRV
jgi:hypothetical protein